MQLAGRYVACGVSNFVMSNLGHSVCLAPRTWYSTVQYSTWYQVLGTKCFALSPGRHHGLPSPAILINNVDFEYCVPSITLGTVPSAWHEIHGTKYSTCVPVVPGVQYARSHVGLDKLHFEPFSLH